MSLPDEDLPMASFVQDEMIDSLCQALARGIGDLPAAARLRLLAFMHLIESPETLTASLEVKPTGHLRLVMDTFVTPARGHQH